MNNEITRRVFAASAAASILSAAKSAPFGPVRVEGTYPRHLQGVCANGKDRIYWSFTDVIVASDPAGKIVKTTPGPNHLGDLCYRDGKLYVAVNLGKFNDPEMRADSWVYVYNAADLSLLEKHKTPEAVYGAGGIDSYRGRFFVVGGLPEGFQENYIFEYDRSFRFVRKHVLKSGYTRLGIQTAAFSDGHWWFGCYGKPAILLKADAGLQNVQRFEFDGSLGIVPLGGQQFLIAKGPCVAGSGCIGELALAEADATAGLRWR